MKKDGDPVDRDMVNNVENVEAEGEGSSVGGRGKAVRKGSVQCKLPLSRISGFMAAPRVMCLFCDRSFLSAVLLQKHTNRCHRVTPTRRTSARNTEQQSVATLNYHPGCNFCNSKALAIQKADDLPALFHHLLDKHSLKYFGCRLCEQRFSNSSQLKSHNQVLHPELLESSISNNECNTKDEIKCSSIQLPASETNNEKVSCNSLRHSYESIETDLVTLNAKFLTKRVSMCVPSKSLAPILTSDKKELRSRKSSSKTRSAKTLSKETSAIPPDTRQQQGTKNSDIKNVGSLELKNLQDVTSTIPPPPPKEGLKSIRKNTSDKDETISESIDKKLSKMARASVALTPVQIKPVSNNETQILSRLGLAQNRSPRTQSQRRNRKTISAETRSSSELSRRDKSKGKNENEFIIHKNKIDPSSKFDPNFYSTVSYNVRENLLKHLDGKLEKSKIACDVPDMIDPKVRSTHAVLEGPLPKQPAEIHTSDVALNAIATFPTLLASDQYGSEKVPHYSYGATTQGFKKTITKNSWKWKWDINKKLKPIHDVGKRDLSRLDIWTQLTMRERYDSDQTNNNVDCENSDVDMVERQRQVSELNDILDRRIFPDIQTELKMSERNEDETVESMADDKINKTEIKPQESTEEKLHFMAAIGLMPKPKEETDKMANVFSGEWQRPRCYVCCVCGRPADCLKLMEAHQASQHPYAQPGYYELVGKEAMENQLHKHLYIPGSIKHLCNVQKKVGNKPNSTKVFKSNQSTRILRTTARNIKSQERPCTKCKKTLSPSELHKHILECAGDYTWIMTKKKFRSNKPFGVRKRRLKGLYKRERPEDEGERSGKDTVPRPKLPPRPRSKPSDVETIQRMLANLPAKRTSKQVLNLPMPKTRKVLNSKQSRMLRRILPDPSLTRTKTTVVRTIKDGKLRRVTRSIKVAEPVTNKIIKSKDSHKVVENKKVKTSTKPKKDVEKSPEPFSIEESHKKSVEIKKRRCDIVKKIRTAITKTDNLNPTLKGKEGNVSKNDASSVEDYEQNDDSSETQQRMLRRRPEKSIHPKIRRKTKGIISCIIEKSTDSYLENNQRNTSPVLVDSKGEVCENPTPSKPNASTVKRKSKKVLGLPLKWIGKRGRISKTKKKFINNIEIAENKESETNTKEDQVPSTPTCTPSSPKEAIVLDDVDAKEDKVQLDKQCNVSDHPVTSPELSNATSKQIESDSLISLSNDSKHSNTNMGYSNLGNQSQNSQNQSQYQTFYNSTVQGASVSNLGSKTLLQNYNHTPDYYNLPKPLQILSPRKDDKSYERTINLNKADDFAFDNIDKPPLFSSVRAQSQMKEISHHEASPGYMVGCGVPTLAMQKAYSSSTETNFDIAYNQSCKSKISSKSNKRGLNDCIAMLRGKLTSKNTDELDTPVVQASSVALLQESNQYEESLQPLDLSGRCQAEDLSVNRNKEPENLTLPKPMNVEEEWQEVQDLSMKPTPKITPTKQSLLSVRKPVFDPTLRIPQFSAPVEPPLVLPKTTSSQSAYIPGSTSKNTPYAPKVVAPTPSSDLPINISHELSLLPQALVNTIEKLPPFQQEEIVKVLPQVLVKAVENYNLLRSETSKRQNEQDILKNISSLTTPIELTHNESPATREEHIRLRPSTIPQTSEISTQTSVPTKEEEIQKCPPEYVNVNTDLYLIDPISGMISERKIDKIPKQITEPMNMLPLKPRVHEVIDLTDEVSVKEPEEVIPAAIIEKPKDPDSQVRSVVVIDPSSLDKNKTLERNKPVKGTTSLRAVRIKSNSEKMKIKNLALSETLDVLPPVVSKTVPFLAKPVPEDVKEPVSVAVQSKEVLNDKEEMLNLNQFTENTITSSKDKISENASFSDLTTLEFTESAIQQDEVSSTQHSAVEDASDSSEVSVKISRLPIHPSTKQDQQSASDVIASEKVPDDVVNPPPPIPDVTEEKTVVENTPTEKTKTNARRKRGGKGAKDKKTTENADCNKLKENTQDNEIKEINPLTDKRDKCEPKANEPESDKKTSLNNLLKECNSLSESALTPSNVIDFHTERKALDKCESIQISELIQDEADADRSISVRRSLRSKKTILKETQSSIEKDTNDVEPVPDLSRAIIPEESYKANLGNTKDIVDQTNNSLSTESLLNKEESDEDDDVCLAVFSKKNPPKSKVHQENLPQTIPREISSAEKSSMSVTKIETSSAKKINKKKANQKKHSKVSKTSNPPNVLEGTEPPATQTSEDIIKIDEPAEVLPEVDPNINEHKKETTRKSGRLKSQKDNFTSIDSVKLSDNGHLIFKMHKELKETCENNKDTKVADVPLNDVVVDNTEIIPSISEPKVTAETPIKGKKSKKSKSSTNCTDDKTIPVTEEILKTSSLVSKLQSNVTESDHQPLQNASDLPDTAPSDKKEVTNKKQLQLPIKEVSEKKAVSDKKQSQLSIAEISGKKDISNKKLSQLSISEVSEKIDVSNKKPSQLPIGEVFEKEDVSNKKQSQLPIREASELKDVSNKNQSQLPVTEVSIKKDVSNKKQSQLPIGEVLEKKDISGNKQKQLPITEVSEKKDISNKKPSQLPIAEVFEKKDVSNKKPSQLPIGEVSEMKDMSCKKQSQLSITEVTAKKKVCNKKQSQTTVTEKNDVFIKKQAQLSATEVTEKKDVSTKKQSQLFVTEVTEKKDISNKKQLQLPVTEVREKKDTSNKKRSQLPITEVYEKKKDSIKKRLIKSTKEISNEKTALSSYIAQAIEDENDKPLISFKKESINKKSDTCDIPVGKIQTKKNKLTKVSALVSQHEKREISPPTNKDAVENVTNTPEEVLVPKEVESKDQEFSNSSDEDIVLCKLVSKKNLKKLKTRSSPRKIDPHRETSQINTLSDSPLISSFGVDCETSIINATTENRKTSARLKKINKKNIVFSSSECLENSHPQNLVSETSNNDPKEALPTPIEEPNESEAFKLVIEKRSTRKTSISQKDALIVENLVDVQSYKKRKDILQTKTTQKLGNENDSHSKLDQKAIVLLNDKDLSKTCDEAIPVSKTKKRNDEKELDTTVVEVESSTSKVKSKVIHKADNEDVSTVQSSPTSRRTCKKTVPLNLDDTHVESEETVNAHPELSTSTRRARNKINYKEESITPTKSVTESPSKVVNTERLDILPEMPSQNELSKSTPKDIDLVLQNKKKFTPEKTKISSSKDVVIETPKLTPERVLSPRKSAKKSLPFKELPIDTLNTAAVDVSPKVGKTSEQTLRKVKKPLLDLDQCAEKPCNEIKTKALSKEISTERDNLDSTPLSPRNSKKRSILERELLIKPKEVHDNLEGIATDVSADFGPISEKALSPRKRKVCPAETEILVDISENIKLKTKGADGANKSKKKSSHTDDLLDELVDKTDDEPLSKSIKNFTRNLEHSQKSHVSDEISDESQTKIVPRKSSRTAKNSALESFNSPYIESKSLKECSKYFSESDDTSTKVKTATRSSSRLKSEPSPDDILSIPVKNSNLPRSRSPSTETKSVVLDNSLTDQSENSSAYSTPIADLEKVTKKKISMPIIIDTTPKRKVPLSKLNKKNKRKPNKAVSNDEIIQKLERTTKKCLVSLNKFSIKRFKRDQDIIIAESHGPSVTKSASLATVKSSEKEGMQQEKGMEVASINKGIADKKKVPGKDLNKTVSGIPSVLLNPDIIESSNDLNTSFIHNEDVCKRRTNADVPRKPSSRKHQIVHVDVHVPREETTDLADIPLLAHTSKISENKNVEPSIKKNKKHKKKAMPIKQVMEDFNAIMDDDLSSEEPLQSIVEAAKRQDEYDAKISEEEASDKTDSSTCLASLVTSQRRTKKKKSKTTEKLSNESLRKKFKISVENKPDFKDDSFSDSDSLIKLKSLKDKSEMKCKKKSLIVTSKDDKDDILPCPEDDTKSKKDMLDTSVKESSDKQHFLPTDPESIQDKYLADFGMYTEKRPRKSTLLAMKKISKTFRPDNDDESDDIKTEDESKTKKAVNKKIKKTEIESKTVHNEETCLNKVSTPIAVEPISSTEESTTAMSPLEDILPVATDSLKSQNKFDTNKDSIDVVSNIPLPVEEVKRVDTPATEDEIDGSKKQPKGSEYFCLLCKRKFRKHDNLLKHEMTLMHISRVSEEEAKVRESGVVSEDKALIQDKEQVSTSSTQSVARVHKNLAERKSFDNKSDIGAEIQSIDNNKVQLSKDSPKSLIQIPADLSRKTLSTDEALFFECCSLLKESNDIPHGTTVEPESDSYRLTNDQNNSSSDSTPYISGVKNILKASELVPPSLTGESDNTMELSQTDSNSEIANVTSEERAFAFANKSETVLRNDSNENHFKHFLVNKDIFGVSNKSNPVPEEKSHDSTKKCSGEYDPYSAESLMVRTNSDDFSDNGDSMISSQDTENMAMQSKNANTNASDKSTSQPILVNVFEDKFDKIKRKAREKAQAAQEAMAAVIAPHRSHTKKSNKKNSSKSRKSGGEKKSSQSQVKPQKTKSKSKKKNILPATEKVSSKKILTKGALKGFDSVKISISSEEVNFQNVLDTKQPTPDYHQDPNINLNESNDFVSNQDKSISMEISTKKFEISNKSLPLFCKNNLKAKQKMLLNYETKRDSPIANEKHDIYEFMDDEYDMSDSFKFRTPTAINRATSSKKGELLVSSATNCSKTSLDVQNDDSQISSLSFSDRDDFTYMSDDYNAHESEEETNHSSNSLEGTVAPNKSLKKHKKSSKHRNIKKNAIMGKIFKNNAIRNNDQSPSGNEGTDENQSVSLGNHADMDQLFDSLFEQGTPEDSQANKAKTLAADVTDTDDVYSAGDEIRRDEKAESNARSSSVCESDSDNDDDDPNPPIPSYPRSSQRKIVPRLKARSSDDETLQPKQQPLQQLGGKKSEIGVASHKSQRKCTTGKQNVLVESWSSESDYEDFRQFEEYSSIPRPQKHHHRRPRRSGRHRQMEQIKGDQAESTEILKSLEQISNTDDENKLCNFNCREDIEAILDTPELKQDHDNSNSPCRRVSFTPNMVFKNKSSKRKRRQSQKPFDYDDEFKPTRIAEPLTTQRRNKRAASEMLYYWSSSSDDDVKNASSDVTGREPEPIEQHGWIVGDSHKKLVTMLAHAKGRKVDDNASVKEKKSRPSS